MALSTFAGNFAANTATGNQSVTGVGFQPKIVMFFMNDKTADGSAAGARLGFGFGVSSTDRRCVVGDLDDATGLGNYSAGHDDTKCINLISQTPTVLFAADLVTLDADGFTINITTSDAVAHKIGYFAIGGTDLTNVKTGQFTRPTATGNQATTGVGFKPDFILLFACRDTTTAPPANSNGSAPRYRIGGGTSSTSRGNVQVMHKFDTINVKTIAQGYARTAEIFSALDEVYGTPALLAEADLVSLDADGFTLNWTTVDANARYVHYVAFKGGQYKIGTFNQATATGNQAITGIGFAPKGIMLLSRNLVASTTIDANGRFSLGVASSSTARMHAWVGDGDNAAVSIADQNLDSTKAIKMMTEATLGNPTTQAAADLVTLDSNGFTLNWTTADATAREIIYMAFGSNAATGDNTDWPVFQQRGFRSWRFS